LEKVYCIVQFNYKLWRGSALAQFVKIAPYISKLKFELNLYL